MFKLGKMPEKVMRNLRRFNAWLVPPQRYKDTIGLGFSILEESYFTAKNFLDQAPWMAMWPGLAIFLVVLGFNLVGDGLRDALDPRDI